MRTAGRRVRAAGIWLLMAGWVVGCTSRAKTHSQTQAAFEAGQLQAFRDVATRQNGVTFIGPVMNPVVPWAQGLTLGQAVVKAGWSERRDPRRIVFLRNGESVEMTPAGLLEAADFPVEPGDRIEMFP